MRDIITNLGLIALAGFFVHVIAQVAADDLEKRQQRYEQCIAANKQWVRGSCVK